MNRKPIDISQLLVKPHHLFHHQWVLLTAGDFAEGKYNAMTISWGALGTMWSKPFAFVAVRHSRFTFQFMEQNDSFTLTAFPKKYHDALSLLGTKSGRDTDKITLSGLTPEASEVVAAPSFTEAEITIECQKMYANDLDPTNFLNDSINKHYPNKDYHRIYYGHILHATGTEAYHA